MRRRDDEDWFSVVVHYETTGSWIGGAAKVRDESTSTVPNQDKASAPVTADKNLRLEEPTAWGTRKITHVCPVYSAAKFAYSTHRSTRNDPVIDRALDDVATHPVQYRQILSRIRYRRMQPRPQSLPDRLQPASYVLHRTEADARCDSRSAGRHTR
ncbi:hypothetical protein RHA1_ro10409 (plasmid) [Rhodococcus jostii RHA1]|uniref:Uncharacterized protein n=1 Tax=Rhodococcus jostii (strain RHA1) TaxID=101510 RepID=Q0RVT8_RHOJR|nr:hypothetical protein RHA1_ro10409 [Rhodococcus jostii RHA1]